MKFAGIVFLSVGFAAAMMADDPSAQLQRSMAVTVDDLPVAQPSWHTNQQMDRITTDLLAVFAEHGVPAVGFVNEQKLAVEGRIEPFRVEILERWLEAGLELGNHGFAHLDLHRVPPEEWMADVVRGERETRRLVEASGTELRYFRHPFLHAGMSVEIQAETAEFLASRGYTAAPVTIDNSEWIYGRAYAHAYNLNDDQLKNRIGEDYVRYMLEVVEYYEGQSDVIVGRPIPHILLVHAYALNADWLGELLVELEERGYGWISLDEALEDPVYEKPISGWIGMGGITWLHRWAITDAVDPFVFQGEPEPPEWVAEIRP
jgi:peptidoglycan/xylan/chitin deacetylase (PgdA/CDA1 family)